MGECGLVKIVGRGEGIILGGWKSLMLLRRLCIVEYAREVSSMREPSSLGGGEVRPPLLVEISWISCLPSLPSEKLDV